MTANAGENMPSSRTLVTALIVAMLALVVLCNVAMTGEQQFSHLAGSFASGKLFFLQMPGSWADAVPYEGRHYWPLGPFPAVLLMPFVLLADSFGIFFRQGYLQIFLVLGVVFLCFRIARRLGYSRNDSLCHALGFGFATAFLGVALLPWSWYFSQVVTVLLLFLAIHEHTGRRRYWLTGIYLALALATRLSASLGILWMALDVLTSRESWARRARHVVVLVMPWIAVLLLLMAYNNARFDDPFEQGYSMQTIPPHAVKARDHGVLSPVHVPGNLYYLLIAPPAAVQLDGVSQVLKFPFVAANPWGMSILVTSPCLIFLWSLSFRDRTSRLLLITIAVISVPILLYYGIGYRQFGYRYSLDFLPFLYYLLMRSYHEQRGNLSPAFRRTVLVSTLVNLYLFAAMLAVYFWRQPV